MLRIFYMNTKLTGIVVITISGNLKQIGSHSNQASTIEQKLNYIHLNPMRGKWSLVNDPTEYYYSSCRFYEKGINDFEFLNDYRDWTE